MRQVHPIKTATAIYWLTLQYNRLAQREKRINARCSGGVRKEGVFFFSRPLLGRDKEHLQIGKEYPTPSGSDGKKIMTQQYSQKYFPLFHSRGKGKGGEVLAYDLRLGRCVWIRYPHRLTPRTNPHKRRTRNTIYESPSLLYRPFRRYQPCRPYLCPRTR